MPSQCSFQTVHCRIKTAMVALVFDPGARMAQAGPVPRENRCQRAQGKPKPGMGQIGGQVARFSLTPGAPAWPAQMRKWHPVQAGRRSQAQKADRPG